MDYKTLLVHLELNGDNSGLLAIAGDLAQRFGARVIGIAAAQPIQILYEEGWVAGEVLNRDREETGKEIAACEAQFRKALEGRAAAVEWRSAITYEPLADYIADQSRCADLIITGKDIGGAFLDNTRRVNVGSLAMQAGRPILIVPKGVTELPMHHVFVAWKDSREARRAVWDALPLLAIAGRATVLEVAPKDECAAAQARVDDTARWLERHGVSATPMTVASGGIEAGQLHAELLDRKCDLLVAGAYGHSRVGEWVFGGVTLDMLLDPDFCVLISH